LAGPYSIALHFNLTSPVSQSRPFQLNGENSGLKDAFQQLSGIHLLLGKQLEHICTVRSVRSRKWPKKSGIAGPAEQAAFPLDGFAA
jgi:hypothetical protein